MPKVGRVVGMAGFEVVVRLLLLLLQGPLLLDQVSKPPSGLQMDCHTPQPLRPALLWLMPFSSVMFLADGLSSASGEAGDCPSNGT
jgi:hypothetical protein